MSQSSSYTWTMKTRIVHGLGTLSKVPDELRTLGAGRPFIVTDRGIVQAGIIGELESILDEAGMPHGVYDGTAATARAVSVDESVAAAREHGYDSVVTIGGGSPLVVGKATAIVGANGGTIRDYDGPGKIKNGLLPTIAIPTTAGSGAEVSPFSPVVDDERNVKMLVGDSNSYPHVAILDATLMKSLPFQQAVYSGIDALAHAIEGQLSSKATPITDVMAMGATRMILENLRTSAMTDDLEAKEQMLLASALANMVSGNAKLSLGHGLARNVQALFTVQYGLTIGVFLPISMEFNLPAAVPRLSRLARYTGVGPAAAADRELAEAMVNHVKELLIDLDFPNRFSEDQVTRESVPLMARMACQGVYEGEKQDPRELPDLPPNTPVRSTNIRKATYADAAAMYEEALDGWKLGA